MFFCNCVCAWEPVKLVHGDGRIRSLTHPITVGELLDCHPHHFVCEPSSDGPLFHTGMLPLEMELEEGRVYLLLPLPRLLPHLSNMFSRPPSCPCFSHRDGRVVSPNPSSSLCGENQSVGDASETQNGVEFEKTFKHKSRIMKWFARNHGQLLAAANSAQEFQQSTRSKLMRSLLHLTRKLLPKKLFLRKYSEKLENQIMNQSIMGRVQFSRNRWRPGLECISEVNLLAGLHRDSELTDR